MIEGGIAHFFPACSTVKILGAVRKASSSIVADDLLEASMGYSSRRDGVDAPLCVLQPFHATGPDPRPAGNGWPTVLRVVVWNGVLQLAFFCLV